MSSSVTDDALVAKSICPECLNDAPAFGMCGTCDGVGLIREIDARRLLVAAILAFAPISTLIVLALAVTP